jgi:hypothetical protein
MASTLIASQGQTYDNISELIHTVRGLQVMLDSDVAKLYGYETRRINEAANNNKERFPLGFRFQLNDEEFSNIGMRSKFSTASKRNVTARPYVYSEQGIAMLSGILKNATAVQVSISIMNAFVEMRRILANSGSTEFRLSTVENKLLKYDENFEQVFDYMQENSTQSARIIYKNQFYEACSFLIDLVKSANSSITIIDAYIDSFILELLLKNSKVDKIVIISQKKSTKELMKTNDKVRMIYSKDFHDRYVIIDNKEVYVFGASLKDLGNKVFTIFEFEDTKLFLDSISELIESNL